MTTKVSTKSAKASVSLAVGSPETDTQTFALPPLADMPDVMELVGPAYQVFVQASALIRVGFTFDLNSPPSVYQSTGSAAITMVKGDPDPDMAKAAYKAVELALAIKLHEQSSAEQRAIAAAAKQVEEEAKAVAKAAIEVQIAEQQASLRQLEAELAKA